ncbi:MAG TPA: PD-(D/E)XK nuclease superfamily protein [Polyangiaceae bacterium]|nr:PD-(D/E)XK nuclease superfamily protein [Polyangiaceae bacterium]
MIQSSAVTGNQYRKLIARYLVSAYAERGIRVYEEVSLGTSIIGKQRRVDLFVLSNDGKALAVECKYQDSSGTADEKIPYAMQDLAAQRVPGVIVYAGIGFSEGVLHLLQGSEYAAYCLPDENQPIPIPRRSGDSINAGTWQFDHVLAMTFGWWDVVVAGRDPVQL